MPLLIANDYPPAHGGIQRYMARLAQCLAVKKDAVIVVAPAGHGDREYDQLQRFRTIRHRSGPRLQAFLFMLSASVRACIESRNAYTIASIWFPAGLAAAILPRRLRGPLAVLAHGSEIAPRRRGVRHRLMLFVFNRSEAVFTHSRFSTALVRRVGFRGRVVTIPCGSEPRDIQRQEAREPTILTVGRLVERKGFDRTIEALPEIIARFPNVRYEIIGGGPDEARLRTLADRLGVEPHVKFLGAVDDDAVQAAYARAWCFAMPVRSVGDDVEGFGIVYLEAAIAGLPAIGGRDSGAEDAIADGETGLIVDGNDPAAIAQAVCALLGDRASATAMGSRARDRALADFTWERTTSSIDAHMRKTSQKA